jgi:hypothetical protein
MTSVVRTQAELAHATPVPEPVQEPPPAEDEDENEHDLIEGLSEHHSGLVIEVLLRMIDWMGVNKATWTSAAGVWDMLHSLVPDEANFPVFSHVKGVLIQYMAGRVEIISICVNNCMAFYDCTSSGYSADEWQTESEDFCSICGEDRWLREDINALPGTPRKVINSSPALHAYTSDVTSCDIWFDIHLTPQVMYYLPVKHFVRDLYAQADLVPHMGVSVGNAPPGSVKRSRGWAQKVTNNPVLTGRRDLAFIAQSDGVPYFKDKTCRSGTVATLRVANLPEAMGKQNRNTHLAAVMPSVYLTWCPIKKRGIQTKHNPHNQAPLVTVLADELYDLYARGLQVVDYSMPTDSPGRAFLCRCVLLFWYTFYAPTPTSVLTSMSHRM